MFPYLLCISVLALGFFKANVNVWWENNPFPYYDVTPFFASKILDVESPQSSGEGLDPASQHAQKPVKEKDGSGHRTAILSVLGHSVEFCHPFAVFLSAFQPDVSRSRVITRNFVPKGFQGHKNQKWSLFTWKHGLTSYWINLAELLNLGSSGLMGVTFVFWSLLQRIIALFAFL